MNDQNKYHFQDFTEKNYRKLLRLAKVYYQFATFQNYRGKEKFLIWRHDVDYSVHRAKKIAEIDRSEGIQSTFFFLIHSEFYNLFEKEIVKCVLAIASMGHQIGLHFDANFYINLTEENLKKYLLYERKLLEGLIAQKISVFSFHNPTKMVLKMEKANYQGLINVYSSFFKKNVFYVSDSNGYWRFQRLEDVIASDKPAKVQVLTHSEWWQEKVMSPFERIKRCIKGRADKNLAHYLATHAFFPEIKA